MLKYNFKELKKPIIIDEPAVQDIIILNNNKSVSVTVTTASGQDETKLDVKPGENLRLTVQVGNVEGIRWGGTDNWGYYKLILPIGAEANSVEYDSITVNDITVDPTGGVGAWCTCEKVYNGTDWVLKYTATEANPSTEPRYALFKHSTTDKIVSRGDGAGRPAASEWWVTVMQEGSGSLNPTPQPDPEPEPDPQPDPQPDPDPDPEPEDDIYTTRTSFDDLVLLFSDVIEKQIDGQNTPYTYSYLSSIYNTAESEWDDENSEFFDSETYPDIYPYHGDNNEYETLSFNAMLMWIMASCLSELIPSFSDHGDDDNIQTKLFKFAYDFGKEDGFGNTIPLYNNYTIKGDPNIARLAASAIYCANHDNNQSEITQSREELHGSVIEDSGVSAGWDDLGYLNDKGTSKLDWRDPETNIRTIRPMYTLGYNVNVNSILPIAPGTRVIGYENQAGINVSTLAEQQGEQFFDEEYNYNTDVAIDEYITQNYNLYAGTGNVEDDWNTFSAQSDEVKNKVLVAAMIPACNDFMLFGEKTVEIPSNNKIKYVTFYDPILGEYPLHRYQFTESNQEPDNNTIFRVKGPFFDYENAMFISEPTAQQDAQRTTMLMYMKQIMDIADNCRFPSMCNDYGRIRPLGNKSQYDSITRGETQYDPLSGFNCGNLGALFADTVESREYMQDDTRHDDWPLDSAKSYQSGHSAQGWAIALMLGQINPNRMITNMKHGYELGVLRTIGRYHWNSDVIYGRLCATMCIPIINAMSSLYQRLKASTNPSANPVISIGLRITNNCGEPVTLDGDVKFTLGNPDHSGNYLGWEGVYNGTSHITFSDVPVTLENGETQTFYNVTWIDEETGCGMGGKSPADAEQLAVSGRPRNILFYASGISEKYLCENMSPLIEFENGNVYDVNITYADPNISI